LSVGDDLFISGDRAEIEGSRIFLRVGGYATISGTAVHMSNVRIGTNTQAGTEGVLISGNGVSLVGIMVECETQQTTDNHDFIKVTGDNALISDLNVRTLGADKYKDLINIDAAAAGTTLGAISVDTSALIAGVVVNDGGVDTIDLHVEVIAWAKTGDLEVATGAIRFPITQPGDIIDARAMVDTAPTDASAIFDVNLNGTTIYATQGDRPTIVTTAFDSGFAPPTNVTPVAVGDYLQIDTDQIGSSVAGADVTLLVRYRVQQ
jgi:hypothetical protein